jgi:hypothetical protein
MMRLVIRMRFKYSILAFWRINLVRLIRIYNAKRRPKRREPTTMMMMIIVTGENDVLESDEEEDAVPIVVAEVSREESVDVDRATDVGMGAKITDETEASVDVDRATDVGMGTKITDETEDSISKLGPGTETDGVLGLKAGFGTARVDATTGCGTTRASATTGLFPNPNPSPLPNPSPNPSPLPNPKLAERTERKRNEWKTFILG